MTQDERAAVTTALTQARALHLVTHQAMLRELGHAQGRCKQLSGGSPRPIGAAYVLTATGRVCELHGVLVTLEQVIACYTQLLAANPPPASTGAA
jgi:hypothetical protein